MRSLITLSLRRPVTIFLAILCLVVFGGSSILTTPLELMPEMEFPMLIVITPYPNAAPEDVEALVTRGVEDAAETVTGVENISSTSSENQSMVMIELGYGSDISQAKEELRANLDIAAFTMPEDAGDSIIVEMDVDAIPAVVLSATAEGDLDVLSYVNEYVVPQIDRVDGVASVDVSGGSSQYISVELNAEKMSQYGLTMTSISQLIGSADFTMPAGEISQGNIDISMRGGVSYDTAASLRDIPITLRTGDIIYLSDVATINQKAKESSSLSRTNGSEDVSISVTKSQSAATLDVSENVIKLMDEINAQDIGIKLAVVTDTSEEIVAAVESVMLTMALGIVFAMIVLFIFFRDFKASLIVGSSIPISLLVTLIAMNFMGFTFNMLSLGGLVIGIGMMVDNSIVVIESCFRMRAEGKEFKDAAIEGASIVATSISASTLTTVVVFLPMAMAQGMSGEMFSEMCFTIVLSLLASLISAMTIVPLVFYRLKPREKAGGIINNMLASTEAAYEKLLPKTLKRKGLVVIIAIALLIGSISMVPMIGMELIPATDSASVAITLTTRPGTNLETINELATPIETMVSEHPDVESYTISINSSNNSATINGYLKADRAMETEEVIEEFRVKTANPIGYDIEVGAGSSGMMMGGGSSAGGVSVSIPINAEDYDLLEDAVEQVEAFIASNEYIISTSSPIAEGNPQAEIEVDVVKAAANGLTPAQIMQNVYSVMVGSTASTLKSDGVEYDIVVEFPKGTYENESDLYGMTITNQSGVAVPLMDVADIVYSTASRTVEKSNGIYTANVTGSASLGAPINLSIDMYQEALATLELPDGVTLEQSSDTQQMIEEFTILLQAILTATFLVFIVMAMQFESPRFSIIVMFSIPFALIGSFGCLLLFGATISMVSLLGFLMLVGTVVNNGILLIDTTNRLRNEESKTIEEALCIAGKTRLRPILMTTLTTVLAMVPMAMGIGDSGSLMQGMAFVVIGGLVASTVLTLLLLPTFYAIIAKKPKKAKKSKKNKKDKGSRNQEIYTFE